MSEEENMKSSNWRKGWKIAYQVILGVVGIFLGWLSFGSSFGENICHNISTCYTVAIFLVGIIITLKLKILDQKERKVDLIFFIIGGLLNLLFLGLAFFADTQNNEKDALLFLNAVIWFDIIIAFKNLVQVIIIYWKEHFNCKDNSKKKKNNLMTKEDLFEQYLIKDDTLIKRALTDKSYKNVDHNLKDEDTNFDLATYGEAVIKFCYSELLLDNVKNMTHERAKYESDKFLVEKVAKHYNLINKIKRDEKDIKIPTDYNYVDSKKKFNPHKYIATAAKAIIGAIYKETKDLQSLLVLLDSWRKF